MSLNDPYRNGFDEESGKRIDANSCPECDGTLATEGGEIRCADCGLIVDTRRLAHGTRPRRPDDTDDVDSRRTGAPLTETRHDRGLSSEIGYDDTDANGNPIPVEKHRRLARMRREHDRGRFESKAERNLAEGCTEIARLVSALDLPRSIREEASDLFRRAQKRGLLMGRSLDQFAAASVHAASRCSATNRSTDELVAAAGCTETQLRDGYSILNRTFDLQPALQRPRGFVPEIAAACDVPDEVQHRALELARTAESAGIANGRNPVGVAAACVYVAGYEWGRLLTQSAVADTAGVSVPTLRTRRDELRNALEE